MANFHQVEQLVEQSTTSTSMTDVPGASLTFTPGDTGETWLVFASGILRSSSTTERDAEIQLLVNGVVVDYWGHQNNAATTPNGAGWWTFDRITGTVAAQTVKLQFRSVNGNTTYASSMRLVVAKLPANADFRFQRSDGIVSTTGSNVQILSDTWTPGSSGNYYLFGKVSHTEDPSGSTSQAWAARSTSLHPNAPAGTYYSCAREPWSPTCVVWRENLAASSQTLELRFTSSASGAQASEHRYRKVMAFREDAWDAAQYAESLAQSTTTSGSFQTKNSLAVDKPPTARDHLIIQSARISGNSTGTTVRKAGELREASTALVRSNHRINRNGSNTQGYHHMIGVVKAEQRAAAVTHTNGFLSPDGDTIQCAESVLVALRYPPELNSPLYGMVA